MDADALVILTGVDYVCINYGKPDEKQLTNVTVAELEEYKQAGHLHQVVCYRKLKPPFGL